MKNVIKHLILFVIGGSTYYFIECMFHLMTKGIAYSHWTMFFLGAICFLIVGGINEFFSWKTPFWKQCAIGAVTITAFELIVGCIVNLWLGWNVWDYNNLPLSFFNGQINLFFSIAWFMLSGVAIIVDDWLRYWLFCEEKPHYKFL